MLTRRRMSPRMQDRLYASIARDIKAAAERAEARRREAEARAVCPDGDDCHEQPCTAARAALRRGATWQEAHAILYPTA